MSGLCLKHLNNTCHLKKKKKNLNFLQCWKNPKHEAPDHNYKFISHDICPIFHIAHTRMRAHAHIPPLLTSETIRANISAWNALPHDPNLTLTWLTSATSLQCIQGSPPGSPRNHSQYSSNTLHLTPWGKVSPASWSNACASLSSYHGNRSVEQNRGGRIRSKNPWGLCVWWKWKSSRLWNTSARVMS